MKMSEFNLNSKSFYTALNSEKLIGTHCNACGHQVSPQRAICPKCQSDQVEIVEFSGKGKLVAFTVVSVPPTHMAEAGYSNKNPYCVGIVELEEGPRVTAQILDVDVYAPQTIKIGKTLSMTTIERGTEENRKKFLAFE
jgi:uncharacterized OB-fold protein